ncbi:hypothetical protein K440DRAFT_620154 [Wilcoxina mikolae CBS 423.85]|nr:hypothetical protein K440DRAFT_620154 [Wilcoxina mikolae CBS 423.85]
MMHMPSKHFCERTQGHSYRFVIFLPIGESNEEITESSASQDKVLTVYTGRDPEDEMRGEWRGVYGYDWNGIHGCFGRTLDMSGRFDWFGIDGNYHSMITSGEIEHYICFHNWGECV